MNPIDGHVQTAPRPCLADQVAQTLAQCGIHRVYGLIGSHVKPLWAAIESAGIHIVQVRHEVAAVHMAQADADLTGRLTVAIVTAGPGVTNAITGVAAAAAGNSPVLILAGAPPRPQHDLGAMEELAQVDLLRPVTRFAKTVRHERSLLPLVHQAICAAAGDDDRPGPAFLEIPVDLLRQPQTGRSPAAPTPRWRRSAMAPSGADLDAACEAIHAARRPVLISGRGAAGAGDALTAFLDASGAMYLDTGGSRNLVDPGHPSCVPASRARVMAESDLVITAGRQLDFALAYGSPAAFTAATAFLRIGRYAAYLDDNRGGDIQVKADVDLTLTALAGRATRPARPDQEWIASVQADDRRRRQAWAERARNTPRGDDGRIHPNYLLQAINQCMSPGRTTTIADGGDILSFARIGLQPTPQLDPGALGCLGVGVPFAIAASLCRPDDTILAVVGDGSFGFNALELDTARREKARIVVIVANNDAWNIERMDTERNFPAMRCTGEIPNCRYDRLATSLGVHAARVTDPADLKPAILDAIDHAPAVLDVQVSKTVPSPDFTSGLADLGDLHAVRAWDRAELALRKEAPPMTTTGTLTHSRRYA